MEAVVLETDVLGLASQFSYDNSLTSYQFPARYLKHFRPLFTGADMLALIYETRGTPPRGRMAYVGWAVLRGNPRRDLSASANTYRADFLEPVRSFAQPVPREIEGEPVKRWLREYPRGRPCNTAT